MRLLFFFFMIFPSLVYADHSPIFSAIQKYFDAQPQNIDTNEVFQIIFNHTPERDFSDSEDFDFDPELPAALRVRFHEINYIINILVGNTCIEALDELIRSGFLTRDQVLLWLLEDIRAFRFENSSSIYAVQMIRKILSIDVREFIEILSSNDLLALFISPNGQYREDLIGIILEINLETYQAILHDLQIAPLIRLPSTNPSLFHQPGVQMPSHRSGIASGFSGMEHLFHLSL